MDMAIAELIGTDGGSMYNVRGGQAAGPSMMAQASAGANVGGGVSANGTAIVLILVTVGLMWFYWANKGLMR